MKNRILALTGLVLLLTGFALRAVYQTGNLWYSIPKNPELVILYPATLISNPYEGVRNFLVIIFILILVILFLIAFIGTKQEKQGYNF
jgi:hypothetical protein